MKLLDRLINNYLRYSEDTGVWYDVAQMKLKALLDFQSGKQLTDRQQELVREVFGEYRKGLESDLRKIDDEVDLNMEFAQHLQQSIDEIDKEMEKLDGGFRCGMPRINMLCV